MMYLLVIVGFVFLLGGAEIMVRGAVALARRLGVSTLVIGMTVVAFGTSAPELVVSLNAAISGAPGLAVGNIVGSNVANILLILGVAGIITPIFCKPGALVRDGIVLLVGSGVFAALIFRGVIDFTAGAVLLVFFVAFLGHSYWRERGGEDLSTELHMQEAEEFEAVPEHMYMAIVFLIGGFTGLILGAEWLVDGGVAIALAFDVDKAVIGLTVVAIGTSLPELAASCVAAYRGHTDVALGNVVGSNLFNVLFVIGTVAVVTPLDVPVRVLNLDIWVMVAATLLFMPFMLFGRQYLGRIEAGIFLALYAAYMASIALGVDDLSVL